MKRVFAYPLIFLGLSTLLVQCVATQKDMEYTNVQVRKVDSKVEDIDKEIAELKKQTVKEVQERQAETGNRLDYHQTEMLRLQGKIDENNFLIRQLQNENADLKKALQTRMDSSEKNSLDEINKLKSRVALSEEQLLKAYDRLAFTENEIKAIKEARSQEAAQRALEAAQRAREAERQARLAAEREAAEREASEREAAEARKRSAGGPREILPEPLKIAVSETNMPAETPEEKMAEETAPEPVIEKVAEPAPKPVAPSQPEPAAPEQPSPISAAATPYDKGLTLFNQKKYREAYNNFTEYLDKNPDGPQAVQARYYAAECLFEEKDYELAILEFQKVIVEHPKDSLASKALYRQGLSFEKIGDSETARIVYNKLVDAYPGSPEMASAKSRLEELKR